MTQTLNRHTDRATSRERLVRKRHRDCEEELCARIALQKVLDATDLFAESLEEDDVDRTADIDAHRGFIDFLQERQALDVPGLKFTIALDECEDWVETSFRVPEAWATYIYYRQGEIVRFSSFHWDGAAGRMVSDMP